MHPPRPQYQVLPGKADFVFIGVSNRFTIKILCTRPLRPDFAHGTEREHGRQVILPLICYFSISGRGVLLNAFSSQVSSLVQGKEPVDFFMISSRQQ